MLCTWCWALHGPEQSFLQTNKDSTFKENKRPLENSPGNQQSDKQTCHTWKDKHLCKVITHEKVQAKRFDGRFGSFQTRLHSHKTVTIDCLMQLPRSSNHSYNRSHFSITSTVNAFSINSYPYQDKVHLRKFFYAPDRILLPALTMLPKWALHSSKLLTLLSGFAHQVCEFLSLPTITHDPGWSGLPLKTSVQE